MAASVLAPFWHEATDADGNKTGERYQLRGLKALELFDVNAHAIVKDDQVSFPGASIKAGLMCGLLGWEGLTDENGAAIPFKKSHIENLSFQVMSQLFGQIMGASSLGVEAAKN